MNMEHINASNQKEAIRSYQTMTTDSSLTKKKTSVAEGLFANATYEVSKQNGINKNTTNTYSTTGELNSNTYAEQFEKVKEQQLENDEKEELEKSSNQLTEEDCEEAWEEGFSLEAFEAGRLARALERMKQNREFQSENLDMRIESQVQWKEEIEKIAVASKIPDSAIKSIAKKLIESDMPLTDENIEQLVGGMKMAEKANEMSDSSMAYMIRNDLEPTIHNIYHSSYSGEVSATPSEETWQAIKGQVENILNSNQLAINDENMADAKWLFEHDLPITGETIEQYQSLSDIKNNITEDVSIDKMIEAMKQGKNAENANLDSYIDNKLQQAVKDFSEISDKAVSQTIGANKELTLSNLKEKQGKLLLDESILSNVGTTKEEITAYRQLQEVRLKLTVESSRRLAEQGIRVDTSKLQDIVDGLKQLENDFYKNLLKEANVSEGQANIDLLKATTEKVNEIKQAPLAFVGTVVKQDIIQTVDTLHETATTVKATFDKAGKSYETMMTAPRKDLGDSMQKAFRSVEPILEDLGLEPTEDNQRAVKILGLNQMEITKDSVMEMKAHDSKVSTLLERLHPAVTVELIKREINPLNMPIDKLNEQIEQIRGELGVSKEEKYSKYLWKLEKENKITEEERKSYIGIYRLLNNVEQTNGEAIGSVVNAGKELTMNNLLTAVRTIKGKGIDTEVDDSFGGLESLTFTRETITEQINSSYGMSQQSSNQNENNSQYTVDYMNQVLGSIMDEVTPAKLMEISNDKPENLLNESLDVLKDKLIHAVGNKETDNEYRKEMTEALRDTMKTCEDAVDFLNDFHVPTTLQNIMTANEYFTGNKNLFKELIKKADTLLESDEKSSDTKSSDIKSLEESMDALADLVGEKEELQQAYKALEGNVEKLLNKGYEQAEISSSELATLKMLGQGIRLTGVLSRQEHYEIPIRVDENTITSMNLTIVKGAKESGKVQIGMDSERFGKVKAELTVKENRINGFILCETKDGTETIKGCLKAMTEQFEQLGLEVKQLSVIADEKAINNVRHQQLEHSEHTDTKVLYQTAKIVVQGFKMAERNE